MKTTKEKIVDYFYEYNESYAGERQIGDIDDIADGIIRILFNDDVLFITDHKGNRYEITEWFNTNVMFCGFFSGTLRNYHEMIYANLGYGNRIKSIRNIDTDKIYTIGTFIFENEAIYLSDFYIDAFSGKVGAVLREVSMIEAVKETMKKI
jgi:hypothetical protein